MLKTETVKVVKMSDVLDAAHMEQDDCDLFYQHLSGVSWGDADYTLIHMDYFIGSVLDFHKLEYNYTPEQVEALDQRLSALIPVDAYVNLEA